MVIVEACAAGKCVVAFDRAPMNEVAPRASSVLVEPLDIAAYAAALRELLGAEPQALLEKGSRGREAVRRFSWDRIAKDQEAFYERVASETC